MTNPENLGVMRSHPDLKQIPITPENRIFFLNDKSDSQPYLIYQGTGVIAGMLESMADCQEVTGTQASCSFFDKDGEFYPRAYLEYLDMHKNGSTKHTAHFEVDGDTVVMPADGIHCLGAAALAEQAEPPVLQTETAEEPMALAA